MHSNTYDHNRTKIQPLDRDVFLKELASIEADFKAGGSHNGKKAAYGWFDGIKDLPPRFISFPNRVIPIEMNTDKHKYESGDESDSSDEN
jgi:hypothetical protein